jgi:hypothetical protein
MKKMVRSILVAMALLLGGAALHPGMAQSQCEGDSEALALTDIGLRKAGNTGPVSFLVDGTGFSNETVFTLRAANGNSFASTRRAILNNSRAIVTFNLNGAAPGKASLHAVKGTESAALPNILTIAEGLTGGLEIKLEGQTQVKAGQLATLYITYANSGPVDIDIPVLILKVPGATFLGTSPDGKNLGESAFILGIPQNPVYTALRPGVSVSIPFYAKTSGDTQATLVATDPNDPAFASTMLDYSRLMNQGPQGPTPASQQQINEMKAEYGENLSQFYRREIQRLPDMVGEEVRSQYQSVQNIDGEWSLSLPTPVQGKERPSLSALPYERKTPPSSPGIIKNPAPPSNGTAKTWVVIITDNDYSSLTQGQILNNATHPEDKLFPNLTFTEYDGRRVKDLFTNKYRIPESQVFWLKDVSTDQFTLTPEAIDDTIKGIPADGDDKLVIWYSGHGMGPDKNFKFDAGTWALNGGGYTSDQLKDAIKSTHVGSTYVFSDSCFSGAFVDRLEVPNTLALAATEPNQTAREDSSYGGWFTNFMVKNLGEGDTIQRAYNETRDSVANESKQYSAYDYVTQEPSTNTEADFFHQGDFVGTNLNAKFPFGEVNLADIVNTSAEGMNVSPAAAAKSLLLTVSSGSTTPTYVPGGIAVCPTRSSLYITDNTNGRILMVTPRDPNRRKLTLVDGLSMPGDIDLSDNGRSLSYVSGGTAQKIFFGLTGFVTDAAGTPLSGATVIFQSNQGETLAKVDANGYFTLMNLLRPSLGSRTVFVTITSGGKSQLYSLDLNTECQTVAQFRFSGTADITSPEPGYDSQSSGDSSTSSGTTMGSGAPPSDLVTSIDNPKPEEIPVLPGKNTLVPTQVVEKPAQPSSGGSNPKIIIVTPVDELETADTTLVLTGWVSDRSITQAFVEINGTKQEISVANGSFAKVITLGQGLNTIRVRATFPLQGEGQSSPVKVTINPGFAGASGSVTGRVLNLNSSTGAAGIKVVETNTCRETTTDSEGYYKFTALPVGKARVHVRP